MKKSDLVEVIRKVVRKEVKLAIKEELSKKQPSSDGEFNNMMEQQTKQAQMRERIMKQAEAKQRVEAEKKAAKDTIELAVKKENFLIHFIRLNENSYLSTLRTKLTWGLDKRN